MPPWIQDSELSKTNKKEAKVEERLSLLVLLPILPLLLLPLLLLLLLLLLLEDYAAGVTSGINLTRSSTQLGQMGQFSGPSARPTPHVGSHEGAG